MWGVIHVLSHLHLRWLSHSDFGANYEGFYYNREQYYSKTATETIETFPPELGMIRLTISTKMR